MSTGRLGAGDTAIQPTILDAKGDLIVATAADTPARLAVGSANQVLTVDSSTATGLKWATPTDNTGMTLLSTVTMSGVSSASFQNISASYKHLFFTFEGFNPATNNVYLQGRLNNDSGSNYSVGTIRSTAGASTVGSTGTGSFLTYMNESAPEAALVPGANSTGGNWQVHGYTSLWIYNYTDTATIFYQWLGYGYNASYSYNVFGNGIYNASAAITRADFYTSSGNANCTIKLYGVS